MKILIFETEKKRKVVHLGTNSQMNHLKEINEKLRTNTLMYENEIDGYFVSTKEYLDDEY